MPNYQTTFENENSDCCARHCSQKIMEINKSARRIVNLKKNENE